MQRNKKSGRNSRKVAGLLPPDYDWPSISKISVTGVYAKQRKNNRFIRQMRSFIYKNKLVIHYLWLPLTKVK